MRRINNLQFIIYNFFLLIFTFYILHFTFYISPVLALDTTPSASQGANFKSKLRSLQEEIASKAAEFKSEISQKLQNRAYVGTVLQISDTLLALSTLNGPKTIIINQDTQVSNKTINPGDFLAALGDIDTSEVLTAKKIVRLTTQLLPKEIVTGTITSLDSTKITLQDKSEKKWQFITSSKTDIQTGNNAGSLTDLKISRSVIIVGVNPKAEVYTARFIYIWPYTILPKEKS